MDKKPVLTNQEINDAFIHAKLEENYNFLEDDLVKLANGFARAASEDIMKAGAKGVTYGRNIFAHKNPDKIVDALAGIIFRKETAKEAAKRLAKK